MGSVWNSGPLIGNGEDTRLEETAVDTLLANFLYPEDLKDNIFIPRFKQRLSIIKAWDILASSASNDGAKPLHILDIGCGQGESSAALAVVLGPSCAHVTGIDTARPDYGSPYTVSETHAHIAATDLGKHVSFQRTDAASFLRQPSSPTVDAVTLCHSLWFFPTAESVSGIFATLSQARVPRIYLAEYAFEGSLPDKQQEPHILAARAQTLLHSYKAAREPGTLAPNVRAALDVSFITAAATSVGFVVRREGRLVPEKDMIEGHLEARYVIKDLFAKSVKAEGLAPAREEEVMAYVPRVRESLERLSAAGVEKSRAMDIWWAELELN
ncbi:hypothetical protein diail_7319, partial [Diaporthe ilicicola]